MEPAFGNNYPDISKLRVTQARTKLTQAQKEFRQCLEDADHRDIFLTEQAEAMEAAGQGTLSSNIIALRNAEKSANMHCRLRNIFKDDMVGTLNSVLIEEGTDQWIRITNADKVQDLLVDQNVNHFSQAAETPLASGCRIIQVVIG